VELLDQTNREEEDFMPSFIYSDLSPRAFLDHPIGDV
jgi:hypothetical protein